MMDTVLVLNWDKATVCPRCHLKMMGAQRDGYCNGCALFITDYNPEHFEKGWKLLDVILFKEAV